MFTSKFCTYFRQYIRYQTQRFYIIDRYLFILKIYSYFIFILLVHILCFIVMTPIYLLYSLCVNNQIVSIINLCSIVGVGISLSAFIYSIIKK
jgi:hypothetical protein